MPEWLSNSFSSGTSHSLRDILVRSLIAALCGILVAMIYRLSHGRRKKNPHPLQATLLILTVLIALVSMVIGESVARAFSLVGALSIVRFRTVVDDTRDTAFVIFAVVVGMASGIGQVLIPVVGIPLVGIVAITLSKGDGQAAAVRKANGKAKTPHKLALRLDVNYDEALLGECLERHFATHEVVSVQTVSQGSAVELAYRGKMHDSNAMAEFVGELNRVAGMQSVQLRG